MASSSSRKNKKIIHVPRRFVQEEWGGTESVILNLCREQISQGFNPEIHTSRALCHRKYEVWTDIAINRYRYCYPFFGLSSRDKAALDKKGGNLLSFHLFYSLLKLPDVRLFHAHVLKRMGGAVMVAARMRKKPFIVTLHGNVFDVPEEEMSSITEAQSGHFEWGKPFGAIFRSRRVLNDADVVLCVGFSEFEEAQRRLPHDRVFFLPNGVNPENFHARGRDKRRAQLGYSENNFVFGCISRIDPQKDQLGLIQAFARVVKQRPECRLLLSGPATVPEYRHSLEKFIEDHHLEQSVLLLPPVVPDSPDHAATFAALDCFVLASRHEPFGIVALEAWASEKPVIASKVGGLKYLVKDGENGLSIPPANCEALAAGMLKLAESPRHCRKMAEKGRQMVLENYSWQQIADKLEIIYREAEELVQTGK